MTGIPPNLVDSLDRLSDSLDQNNRTLNQQVGASFKGLKSTFTSFVNPVEQLKNSIQRLDKTNQLSLRQGVSLDKLRTSVNKNSDILTRGLVSNQKVLEAITKNTESGIRIQSGAMMDLTEEMIATGQDLQGLRGATSDLLLFTGENVDAVQRSIRVNQEVSDKYGVSNEKLIQSVNSLRETFDQASFFGGDTTASLQELATQLKGRSGGKNIEGAIRTLFGLGTGGMENVGAAMLTGAGGFRAKVAGGQRVGIGDIEPILARVAQIAEASKGAGGSLGLGADIAAARLGISKEQVNQLLQLNEQLKRNFELDESIKADEDEKFNTIQNINERAKNFYDNTAIGMLAALGSISTSIIALSTGLAQAKGLTGLVTSNPANIGSATSLLTSKSARASAFADFKKAGLMGNLGKAAGGLGVGALAGGLINSAGGAMGMDLGGASTGATLGATIGSVIPGVGTLIGGAAGGVIGFAADLLKNTGDTAEATTEAARIAEEERLAKRREEAQGAMSRLDFLAGYIRSRGGSVLSDPDVKRTLQSIDSRLAKAARQREDAQARTTGTGRTGG